MFIYKALAKEFIGVGLGVFLIRVCAIKSDRFFFSISYKNRTLQRIGKVLEWNFKGMFQNSTSNILLIY